MTRQLRWLSIRQYYLRSAISLPSSRYWPIDASLNPPQSCSQSFRDNGAGVELWVNPQCLALGVNATTRIPRQGEQVSSARSTDHRRRGDDVRVVFLCSSADGFRCSSAAPRRLRHANLWQDELPGAHLPCRRSTDESAFVVDIGYPRHTRRRIRLIQSFGTSAGCRLAGSTRSIFRPGVIGTQPPEPRRFMHRRTGCSRQNAVRPQAGAMRGGSRRENLCSSRRRKIVADTRSVASGRRRVSTYRHRRKSGLSRKALLTTLRLRLRSC